MGDNDCDKYILTKIYHDFDTLENETHEGKSKFDLDPSGRHTLIGKQQLFTTHKHTDDHNQSDKDEDQRNDETEQSLGRGDDHQADDG